jgi:probable regulatory domain-containing protein
MERDGDPVLELFMNAVQAAGGPGRMIAERRLGWLPLFMDSACTLLFQEEEHRDLGEIADLLGTTRDAVEARLAGPAETALVGVAGQPPADEFLREHIAGGLVRHAYTHGGLGQYH